MKLALVEPYIATDALRAYAEKPEPSHLLGMYNLLGKASCDAVLLDAYSARMPAEKLAEWLQINGITHLGLTVYDYMPCLDYVGKVLELIPGDICTIIGGPGPTYCTDRMVRRLRPAWLVKGSGEQVIVELFKARFAPEKVKGNVLRIGDSFVFTAGYVALDDIPYERPYSLEVYDFQASPRVQSGCKGLCVFCSGAYQKEFDYVSSEKAHDLFYYLVSQKGADVLAPNGPDFTAIPPKANALLKTLVDGNYNFTGFQPGVRLDTLYRSIELDPGLWKRLSARYALHLESSIESFSIGRLKRLGKNMSHDFFRDVLLRLDAIFDTCDCTMVLGRIALDPTITANEFIDDCAGFRELLERHGKKMTVGGMIMNNFVPLFGTPATESKDAWNPWLGRMKDPVMRRLGERLFSDDRFRMWCDLAGKLQNFEERNTVFCEILRVAGEQAAELMALNGFCSVNCQMHTREHGEGGEPHMCKSLGVDPTDPKSAMKHIECHNVADERRRELAAGVVEAFAILQRFANEHEWHEHMIEPFFTNIAIFAQQEDLKKKVLGGREGAARHETGIEGLSAALVEKCLMAVTPEEYERIRPEYAGIDRAWPRLLAHEMAHQLHIRLVGSEEKMGPKWFYEGFALYAAGQRFGHLVTGRAGAMEAIRTESRGSYAKYASAFEFFLLHVDLDQMLWRASSSDFEDWLFSFIKD